MNGNDDHSNEQPRQEHSHNGQPAQPPDLLPPSLPMQPQPQQQHIDSNAPSIDINRQTQPQEYQQQQGGQQQPHVIQQNAHQQQQHDLQQNVPQQPGQVVHPQPQPQPQPQPHVPQVQIAQTQHAKAHTQSHSHTHAQQHVTEGLSDVESNTDEERGVEDSSVDPAMEGVDVGMRRDMMQYPMDLSDGTGAMVPMDTDNDVVKVSQSALHIFCNLERDVSTLEAQVAWGAEHSKATWNLQQGAFQFKRHNSLFGAENLAKIAKIVGSKSDGGTNTRTLLLEPYPLSDGVNYGFTISLINRGRQKRGNAGSVQTDSQLQRLMVELLVEVKMTQKSKSLTPGIAKCYETILACCKTKEEMGMLGRILRNHSRATKSSLSYSRPTGKYSGYSELMRRVARALNAESRTLDPALIDSLNLDAEHKQTLMDFLEKDSTWSDKSQQINQICKTAWAMLSAETKEEFVEIGTRKRKREPDSMEDRVQVISDFVKTINDAGDMQMLAVVDRPGHCPERFGSIPHHVCGYFNEPSNFPQSHTTAHLMPASQQTPPQQQLGTAQQPGHFQMDHSALSDDVQVQLQAQAQQHAQQQQQHAQDAQVHAQIQTQQLQYMQRQQQQQQEEHHQQQAHMQSQEDAEAQVQAHEQNLVAQSHREETQAEGVRVHGQSTGEPSLAALVTPEEEITGISNTDFNMPSSKAAGYESDTAMPEVVHAVVKESTKQTKEQLRQIVIQRLNKLYCDVTDLKAVPWVEYRKGCPFALANRSTGQHYSEFSNWVKGVKGPYSAKELKNLQTLLDNPNIILKVMIPPEFVPRFQSLGNEQRKFVANFIGLNRYEKPVLVFNGVSGGGKTHAAVLAVEIARSIYGQASVLATGTYLINAQRYPDGMTIQQVMGQLNTELDLNQLHLYPKKTDSHVLEKARMLLIDGVGDESSQFLEHLDQFLREKLGKNGMSNNAPFGGLRLCLVGDCMKTTRAGSEVRTISSFYFHSRIFTELDAGGHVRYFFVDKSHRATDTTYNTYIKRLRRGEWAGEVSNYFRSMYKARANENAIEIFTSQEQCNVEYEELLQTKANVLYPPILVNTQSPETNGFESEGFSVDAIRRSLTADPRQPRRMPITQTFKGCRVRVYLNVYSGRFTVAAGTFGTVVEVGDNVVYVLFDGVSNSHEPVTIPVYGQKEYSHLRTVGEVSRTVIPLIQAHFLTVDTAKGHEFTNTMIVHTDSGFTTEQLYSVIAMTTDPTRVNVRVNAIVHLSANSQPLIEFDRRCAEKALMSL